MCVLSILPYNERRGGKVKRTLFSISYIKPISQWYQSIDSGLWYYLLPPDFLFFTINLNLHWSIVAVSRGGLGRQKKLALRLIVSCNSRVVAQRLLEFLRWFDDGFVVIRRV